MSGSYAHLTTTIKTNDTGPGVCAQSNDVENPITACKLSKNKDGQTVYYKASESFACVYMHRCVCLLIL